MNMVRTISSPALMFFKTWVVNKQGSLSCCEYKYEHRYNDIKPSTHVLSRHRCISALIFARTVELCLDYR